MTMAPPQPASAPTTRPARFGALAWTAVILGIVGVVGSPIIFLNNLTAVAAAVGVVLGVIALFGTRKVLAAIGVVACVAGIAITVGAQKAAVEELDRAFNGGVSDDASGTYRMGKTHKGDGMTIRVSKLRRITTSEFAAPKPNAKAFEVSVTITNTSNEPVDTNQLLFSASAGDQPARELTDIDRDYGGIPGMQVLPGRKLTFPVAFLRPASGEVVVQVERLTGETVTFTKG
ncbi:MAG: hypothetical protein ACRDQB_00500 [Thermocrispum sp.]